VVQFGTSRFLQAHADLFLDEGTPRRCVTVVQSSGNSDHANRLKHLCDGFSVRIRGMRESAVIDEERCVGSVKRTLSTATQLGRGDAGGRRRGQNDPIHHR
jgi:tagaturonate reductase